MEHQRHTYVPAFDGLRGIAILPVIFLHVGAISLPGGALLFQLTRGWYGVDLFFVLSGFLITWILQRELEATGTIDLRKFYRRRFFRLGPAYISTLTAVLIGAALMGRPEVREIPKVLPALVTCTYNYQIAAGGPHFDVLVVLWSLCVEEQFYLIWPTVLRWLGARRAAPFCMTAIPALALYRIGLYSWLNWGHLASPSGTSSVWIYFATDTRIGVILVGCTAALSLKHPRTKLLWRRIRESRFLPEVLALAAVACAIFITGAAPSSGSWRSATFGYTLGACATAAMIGAVFTKPASIAARALSWRPLVGLGRISYGVYLFHAPIAWVVSHSLTLGALNKVRDAIAPQVTGGASIAPAMWSEAIRKWAADPTVLRFIISAAIVMIMTAAVATLHYRYVERPFLASRPAQRVPRLATSGT